MDADAWAKRSGAWSDPRDARIKQLEAELAKCEERRRLSGVALQKQFDRANKLEAERDARDKLLGQIKEAMLSVGNQPANWTHMIAAIDAALKEKS